MVAAVVAVAEVAEVAEAFMAAEALVAAEACVVAEALLMAHALLVAEPLLVAPRLLAVHGRYGYRGYGYGDGIYPWWGYEEYPWEYEYYYEPACGYVHVKYYRHKRAYWRWVYQCE